MPGGPVGRGRGSAARQSVQHARVADHVHREGAPTPWTGALLQDLFKGAPTSGRPFFSDLTAGAYHVEPTIASWLTLARQPVRRAQAAADAVNRALAVSSPTPTTGSTTSPRPAELAKAARAELYGHQDLAEQPDGHLPALIHELRAHARAGAREPARLRPGRRAILLWTKLLGGRVRRQLGGDGRHVREAMLDLEAAVRERLAAAWSSAWAVHGGASARPEQLSQPDPAAETLGVAAALET